MDCPLLVWMLSYTRLLTKEEYDMTYRIMKGCVPHATYIPYAPDNIEEQVKMMAHLMPVLMMRHRRISRMKWRDCVNQNGKHWIEQDSENAANPTARLRAMIGYHLAWENNLVGMVMTQGRQREIVNVGLGIKQLICPPGTTVAAYAESQYHKLTALEISLINSEPEDQAILRRLCMILALKTAYIKAIGQPIGFDLSRLEFDFPARFAKGDGYPLQGWEFRLWISDIKVLRNDVIVNEKYQCCTAFFRGTEESKFIMQEQQKELESWVQFLNVEQLLVVVPKLCE